MLADIGYHRLGFHHGEGDSGGLIQLLVDVFIVGLICWLIWWLVDYFGLPQPFNKVIKAIVALVAVLFLINVLLGFS